MHNRNVGVVAVRLTDEERRMVAEIATALVSPRRPRVTLSDAMRAAVGEMHATTRREREVAHAGEVPA